MAAMLNPRDWAGLRPKFQPWKFVLGFEQLSWSVSDSATGWHCAL